MPLAVKDGCLMYSGDDVTILIYTFPRPGSEAIAFKKIVSSIERTWSLIGRLKTVIVASHHFEEVDSFASVNGVELQIEPTLVPGDITSMSLDCILRLYKRFSTPYVLIIQDDGFPVRSNLSDFVGKFDYLGAPIISDGWKRRIAYSIGMGAFNGGFSLRTRRLCEYASKCWRRFLRYLFRGGCGRLGEDVYYTTLLKLLPTTWFRYRYPDERTAFEFAFDRLGGHVAPPGDIRPFGVHGRDAVLDCRELVTVLAYHFWEDDGYDEAFSKVAAAFEEAWRYCGSLKSVVVVNKMRPSVERFAAEHPNLSVQVEPRLVPGKIFSMSEDCNARLHSRFDTPYVLTIQNDGWPLREGLESFVGLWDFIGAPYVRDRWYLRLGAWLLDRRPMNGGFSLRSKRCCELVAKYWNEKYHVLGDCRSSSEDMFVTEFLPKHEPEFRKAMRFPDLRTALKFSYEDIGQPFESSSVPFGFHRLDSRRQLVGVGE